jgi:hypothetical protein
MVIMRTKLICSVTCVLALGLVGSAAGQGLKGEYFNNMTLTGSPVLTRVEAVSFDWGDAGSPG